MAKIVNLAEYQKTIAARIQQSVSAPAVGAKLGLEFGGAKYLVDVGEFSEVIPDLEVTPVPFTQPWFLGVADIRGLIHGVVDMGKFAKTGNVRGELGRHYVVSGPQFELRSALLVQRVLGLRRVDEWRQVRMVPTGPAWIKGHFIDEQEETWQEISLKELLGHPDFLQIAQ
ncbi:chemotaxis protein CheW [Methylomagnum sp.]